MEIKSFYSRAGSTESLIAMDCVLPAGESILSVCFPQLEEPVAAAKTDLNETVIREIFGNQVSFVERNFNRPSYKVVLEGGIELYADSLVDAPGNDGSRRGGVQNRFHFGILGPSISEEKIRNSQPIFARAKKFFETNPHIVERERRRKQASNRNIVILVVFLLAVVFVVINMSRSF